MKHFFIRLFFSLALASCFPRPVFSQTGELERAAALTKTAAQTFISLDPVLLQSLQLLETGKLKAAALAADAAKIEIAEREGENSLAFAQACWVLGRCQQALACHDAAIPLFEKSLSLLGSETDALLSALVKSCLANSLSVKKSHEEALRLANQALEAIRGVSSESSEGAAFALFVLGSCHLRKNVESAQAQASLEAALRECREANAGESWLAGSILNILGYFHWKNNNFSQAIEYFQQSENILLTLGKEENGYLANLYLNLGGCLNDMSLYRNAIPLLECALATLKSFDENHSNLSSVYNSLGNAYRYGEEEYSLAISLQKEAMKTAAPERIGAYQNGLGLTFLQQEEFEQAKTEFLGAIEKMEPYREKIKKDYARPFRNLALCHLALEEPEIATGYAEKGLRLSSEILRLDHPDIARSYYLLAQCNAAAGQLGAAERQLDSALQIHRKNLPAGLHEELALAWLLKAEIFFQKKDYARCELLADSALAATGFRQGEVQQVISPGEFLQAILFKANFYRQRGELQLAADLCRTGLDGLDFFRKNLSEEKSRIASIHKNYGLFETAIASNLALSSPSASDFRLKEAFLIAERCKSLALLESMNASKAGAASLLPERLLSQIKDLQYKIAAQEKEQQLLSTGEKAGSLEPVEQSLLELRQQWTTLQRQLKTEYPEFFKFKYEVDFAGVEAVQERLLQPGQTLLEYFTGDSSIFIFAVQQDDFKIFEVKKDFPLELWVNDLRKFVAGSERTVSGSKYAELAFQLYRKLIEPARAMLNQELIIVPDGVLSYLPFELLLAQKPDAAKFFKTHHYLLQDFQVSYCYSATSLREMKEKQHREPPTESVLALAPWFEDDPAALDTLSFADERFEFGPLPNSGKEIAKICRMTGGDAFFKAAANKKRFLELAGKYRILHLSTHGQANDLSSDYSWLSFASEEQEDAGAGLLFFQDLKDLQLNADLVVLSACQTGTGKLRRGEGIASLARAFANAGAKSIVTTLWSVSDEKTQYLMVQFYVHLKAGMAKDKALRQAKLDFLGKHGNADSHPFFWAGFVAIGDMSALSF